jgi:hypothetical protein
MAENFPTNCQTRFLKVRQRWCIDIPGMKLTVTKHTI